MLAGATVKGVLPAPVGFTMSVTGTVLVAAPAAVTVTAALYVPAARPLRFTEALIEPLFVPEAGLMVNQAALSVALQERVPPPVLEIENV